MVGFEELPRTTLGSCPVCAHDVPQSTILIEYETTGGSKRVFAECPGCLDVVHPH